MAFLRERDKVSDGTQSLRDSKVYRNSGACIQLKTKLFSTTVLTFKYVVKIGKELGNCTHQRKTNNDTNTIALSTLSLLQVKEER